MHIPDDEMIDFIAAGSRQMFARFCLLWLDRVVAMAMAPQGDPALAADIAGRALVRLWERAAVLDDPDDVAGCLTRVVAEAAGETTVPQPLAATGDPAVAVLAGVEAVTAGRSQLAPAGLLSRLVSRFR